MKMIIGLLIGALVQFAHAESVTIKVKNDFQGTLDPGVIGYEKSRPIICIKTPQGKDGIYQLDPGTSFTLVGEKKYWYNADVRLNGCNPMLDPYIGYLGIGSDKVQFSSTDKLLNRMEIVGANKGTAPSITGKLSYIAIPENLDTSELKPLNKNRKLTYVGINLSGAEFGKTISANSVPDLSSADKNKGSRPGPDLADMKLYISAGVNTVRVPIRWGYLELLKAPYSINSSDWIWNSAYWNNFIAPALATLTNAGIYTVLDLHSYLHYSAFGTGVAGCLDGVEKCPDGTLALNKDHYIKVWNDILTEVRKNPTIKEEYLMFDLVNEPAANKKNGSQEVVTPQHAFNMEVPVAVALQKANFKGKILLEGASWTGLHSWKDPVDGSNSNAIVFAKQKLIDAGIKFNENSNNVLINVHQYFDDDFSGTQDACLKNLDSAGKDGKKFNTAAFAEWLKAEKLKAIVTEFGTSRKAESSCQPVLNEFVEYLTKNAVKENETGGGFVGATLWATGHDWGNYNLLFGPTTYQFKTFIGNTIEK